MSKTKLSRMNGKNTINNWKLIGAWRDIAFMLFICQEKITQDKAIIKLIYQPKNQTEEMQNKNNWITMMTKLEMPNLDKTKIIGPVDLWTWASLNGIEVGTYNGDAKIQTFEEVLKELSETSTQGEK